MSEASGDTDLERLVEKQARGESAGLPVEDSAAGAAELDTRRSKSPLIAGGLLGQTVHVDIPGAEADSQAFIAHQTGIDRLQPEAGASHAFTPTVTGREVDVAYPDVVDRPDYIEAHMRPDLGNETTIPAVAESVPTPEVGPAAPPDAALNANLYPDTVDQPDVIAGHAGAPAAPQDERMLGEEITPETQVHIGPSQPA